MFYQRQAAFTALVDTQGARCWGIPGAFPCGYSNRSASVDHSQHQRLCDICDHCGGFSWLFLERGGGHMPLCIGCMRCKKSTGLGCWELNMLVPTIASDSCPQGTNAFILSFSQLINLYIGIWFWFTLIHKGKFWCMSTWVLFSCIWSIWLMVLITVLRIARTI